ncbi:OLC1v1005851C1 [Oldenlandia corymbosa var. corymbosa]|uniref:OLC1v1005851C1 n=1 Tax=Oldenlandia corymbosa var. corymbosa TaxID=529605 RepID=A0AAV1DI93_OLDCO|nr:OLC1v1005851C1 [Oldenlandia corymbosa var. corymbosa]
MAGSTTSPMMKRFTVRRQKPVMVRPVRPTPRETKPLSDIDDQESFHFLISNSINFYRRRDDVDDQCVRKASSSEEDPAKVIKAALAETLVLYHPFAGRLIEGPENKLAVECTGDGVAFVEADADVTLEELGEEELQPPFPYLEDLLCNIPDTGGILHPPILSIQVTRLRCGGFIFTYRLNHVMCDATGIVQFMMALAEIARGGASTDSVVAPFTVDDLVCKSFFFTPADTSALRASLPPFLRAKCSSFDVLTAFLWRCRTSALQLDPNREVRILCFVDARSKFDPPIHKGYYGNVLAIPTAVTTAGKLTGNPLGYAVELVMNAKSMVTEDYIKSNADLIVSRGRKGVRWSPGYMVSDLRRAGFDEVDFGWGKPVYAGPALGIKELKPANLGFYIPRKNKKGEKVVVVPIGLPRSAMQRFIDEIKNVVNAINDDGNGKGARSQRQSHTDNIHMVRPSLSDDEKLHGEEAETSDGSSGKTDALGNKTIVIQKSLHFLLLQGRMTKGKKGLLFQLGCQDL